MLNVSVPLIRELVASKCRRLFGSGVGVVIGVIDSIEHSN